MSHTYFLQNLCSKKLASLHLAPLYICLLVLKLLVLCNAKSALAVCFRSSTKPVSKFITRVAHCICSDDCRL